MIQIRVEALQALAKRSANIAVLVLATLLRLVGIYVDAFVIQFGRLNDCDVAGVPAVQWVPVKPISVADVSVVHLAHCLHEVGWLVVVGEVHLVLQTGQILVKLGPAAGSLWVVAVKETLNLIEWNQEPRHGHKGEHHSTVGREGDRFRLIEVTLQVDLAGDGQVAIVQSGKVFVGDSHYAFRGFIVVAVAGARLRSIQKKEVHESAKKKR